MKIDRRTLILGSLGAAACATAPSGPPADETFRNIETPSESVHSGLASPDGATRLTVRLCRYPDLGLAWVWTHARTPAGFFSHVEHMAPCTRVHSPQGTEHVRYSDAAETIVFERWGPVSKPQRASVSGRSKPRRSTTSRFGAGEHDLSFRIDFSPARLYSGLNAGRTEVFGRSRASITIDGVTTEVEGPAQFHEQRQSTPRFTAPFCYTSLWGEDAASTLLISPRRRDGYLLEGDKSTEANAIRLDPPGGAARLIALKMADGRVVEGEAKVTQAYTLPIVGQTWRGHMIDAEVGGRRYFGQMNDFLTEQVPYAG